MLILTPLSALFSDLCLSRGIRKKELAYRLGLDPSHLSAMASGRKGPPVGDLFLQKAQEGLALTDEESARLKAAIRNSKKWHQMPANANPGEHELITKIFDSVGKLKPAQINIISEILKL